MTALHCIVRGRVQGVGFRYSALRRAQGLGLSGWVRNNADGSVETRALGDEAGVAAFVEWLGEGPAYARVDALELRYRGEPRDGDKALTGSFRVTS